jgi:hypothetical protein
VTFAYGKLRKNLDNYRPLRQNGAAITQNNLINMKISCSLLAARLTRSALFATLVLGLSASVANAAPDVTIDLAGKEFGDGVSMTASSGTSVNAATAYYYRVSGTCHGTGAYENYVPPGTSIAKLFNEIQKGGAASLDGVRKNPGGNLPPEGPILHKDYHGEVDQATFDLTLNAEISASGVVTFEVKNVSVTFSGFHISGTIQFEQGAKIEVGVAPVVKATITKTTVNEGGSVTLSAKRSGNLGPACEVKYTTKPGTAGKADFVSKSGTLHFAPGSATPNEEGVTITTKNDTVAEDAESFSWGMTQTGIVLVGVPGKTKITISANN